MKHKLIMENWKRYLKESSGYFTGNITIAPLPTFYLEIQPTSDGQIQVGIEPNATQPGGGDPFYSTAADLDSALQGALQEAELEIEVSSVKAAIQQLQKNR